MIAYKIPETFEGILCALFESFTLKERPSVVFSGDFQPTFDCRIKNIEIIASNCERVRNGLLKCGGISLLSTLFYVMRSSDDLKETIIFNAAYKCLDARKNLTDNFKDADMLALYDLKSKISYEVHRMLGFLRFEKLAGDVYYARITPDNRITDLIAPHFKRRLAKERFIIHDLTRNILSVCDGKDIITVQSRLPVTIYPDQGEIEFQELWHIYFDAVNIKERANKKLQDNFLPIRYRKNMTEFLSDIKNF